MSPKLYAIYVDKMLEKLQEVENGCKIGTIPINAIMYADDTAIIAPTIQILNKLLNIVQIFCYEQQIKLNINKSNYMTLGNYYQRKIDKNILIGDSKLNKVNSVKYLGININNLLNDKEHLQIRRAKMTKSIYQLVPAGIMDASMDNKLKVKLISTYCRPVLYYGIENMTVSRNEMHKLHSCEGIVIKKMLGLSKFVMHTRIMDSLGYERENILVAKRKLNFYKELSKNAVTNAILEHRWKTIENKERMFTRSLVNEVQEIICDVNIEENETSSLNLVEMNSDNIMEHIEEKLVRIKGFVKKFNTDGIADTIKYLLGQFNQKLIKY